jgi:hypothetical protein
MYQYENVTLSKTSTLYMKIVLNVSIGFIGDFNGFWEGSIIENAPTYLLN